MKEPVERAGRQWHQGQDFIMNSKSNWKLSAGPRSWSWRYESSEGEGQWVWLLSLRPTGQRINVSFGGQYRVSCSNQCGCK